MAAGLPTACVVGSGSWGTAFAGLMASQAAEVRLWCRSAEVASAVNATRRNPRHLTSYELPCNVIATSDAAAALCAVEAVVLALPSTHLRDVCRTLAPHVAPDVPVLVLTKGMEPGTHLLMLDVAAAELGHAERMAVLSGPNHAEEICLGQVSAAVLACGSPEVGERLRGLVTAPSFRVYASDDVTGVEICGAMKNVVAIACGIAAGLGAGDNTQAVLMTRGIAEIGRVSDVLGGSPLTPMGLAGMGDLVATCTSEHSRNRTFGEAFVAGEGLAAYEARTGMVVEGAHAAQSFWELAHDHGIEAPLTCAVHDVLVDGLDLASASASLLGRLPREEFYGLSRTTESKGII